MRTTFGALPIGATFEAWRIDKDPADRRRKRSMRVRYVKKGHGSIAGFATHYSSRLAIERRFNHSDTVYIDASDLRLIVACAQHGASL